MPTTELVTASAAWAAGIDVSTLRDDCEDEDVPITTCAILNRELLICETFVLMLAVSGFSSQERYETCT